MELNKIYNLDNNGQEEEIESLRGFVAGSDIVYDDERKGWVLSTPESLKNLVLFVIRYKKTSIDDNLNIGTRILCEEQIKNEGITELGHWQIEVRVSGVYIKSLGTIGGYSQFYDRRGTSLVSAYKDMCKELDLSAVEG